MPTMTAQDSERITLQEAFLRYRVSPATLRYWLDKGLLSRDYDELRRVTVDRDELEQELRKRGRTWSD